MNDDIPNHIEPQTELYIERKARQEADRVFSLIIRMISGIGLLIGIILSLLGVLGGPELIERMISAQLEKIGHNKILEQAAEGRASIIQYKREAETHLDAARQIRTEWEGEPGILVKEKFLNVPIEAGRTSHNTKVSTDKYAAAAIAGFHMYGEETKSCLYSNSLKVSIRRRPQGCVACLWSASSSGADWF